MSQVYQPIQELRYVCPVCGVSYKTEALCTEHMDCHEVSTLRSVSLTHERGKRGTGQSWYICVRPCKTSAASDHIGVITTQWGMGITVWETFCEKGEESKTVEKLMDFAQSDLEFQLSKLEACRASFKEKQL